MTPDDRLLYAVHDAVRKAVIKHHKRHHKRHPITGMQAALLIRELCRAQAMLFMLFTADQTPDNVKTMAQGLSEAFLKHYRELCEEAAKNAGKPH